MALALLSLDHHRLAGQYNQLLRYLVGLMCSPRLHGTIAGVSQIVSDDLPHLVVTAVVQPRYVLNSWFKLGIHCFLQVLAPEVHSGPCHHYQHSVSFGAGRSLLLGESLDSLSHRDPDHFALADSRPKHTRTLSPVWSYSPAQSSKLFLYSSMDKIFMFSFVSCTEP